MKFLVLAMVCVGCGTAFAKGGSSSSSSSSSGSSKQDLSEELIAIHDELFDAIVNFDNETVKAAYADGSVLMPADGDTLYGPADIAEYYVNSGYDAVPTITAQEFRKAKKTVMERQEGSFGNGRSVVCYKRVVIWVKDGSSWQIRWDIFNFN